MNDETVLVSRVKGAKHNHTHIQGDCCYKTNEVNVRRQVTNSQTPMYCAGFDQMKSGKTHHFFWIFLSLGGSVLRFFEG